MDITVIVSIVSAFAISALSSVTFIYYQKFRKSQSDYLTETEKLNNQLTQISTEIEELKDLNESLTTDNAGFIATKTLFNEQIEKLEKNNRELSDKKLVLATDNSSLKTEIENLNKQVHEMREKFDSYKNFYDANRDVIELLKTKKTDRVAIGLDWQQQIYDELKQEVPEHIEDLLEVSMNPKSTTDKTSSDIFLNFYKNFMDKREQKPNFQVIMEIKDTSDPAKQFGVKKDHHELKKTLDQVFRHAKEHNAKFAVLLSNWAVDDDEYINFGIKWLKTASDYKRYGLNHSYDDPMVILVYPPNRHILYNSFRIINTMYTSFELQNVKINWLNENIYQVFEIFFKSFAHIKETYSMCQGYFDTTDELLKDINNKITSTRGGYQKAKAAFLSNYTTCGERLKSAEQCVNIFSQMVNKINSSTESLENEDTKNEKISKIAHKIEIQQEK